MALSSAGEPEVPDVIRLRVPAEPAFARIARLAGGGLAARVGFGYDDVEEVRLAVGEAWAALLGEGSLDATVELTFLVTDERLEVELVVGGDGDLPPSEGRARDVLDQLAGDVAEVAGGRGLRFSRRV